MTIDIIDPREIEALDYAFRPIIPTTHQVIRQTVHYDQPITHYALRTNLTHAEAYRLATADGLPEFDGRGENLTSRLCATTGYDTFYGKFTLDEMHRLTIAFRRQAVMIWDRREQIAEERALIDAGLLNGER